MRDGERSRPKLGKSIIRSRFGKNVNKSGESFLHTSELSDGYDWGRLNLQSVTEQSNLDDFLATAELAGTEFTAEKLNVTFVDPARNSGILSKDELQQVKDAQDRHRQLLRIPRRPAWDVTTTAEELDARERHTFLTWRRGLAELQEVENIHLTPYEKNLDFWRQLWRVIERSDVVVQIVDARNPLLFRCADLETYVQEVDPNKVNLILINKADYLTEKQREAWSEYFRKEGVMVAFWSALEETNKQGVTVDKTEEDNVVVTDEEDGASEEESDEDSRETNLERGDNSVAAFARGDNSDLTEAHLSDCNTSAFSSEVAMDTTNCDKNDDLRSDGMDVKNSDKGEVMCANTSEVDETERTCQVENKVCSATSSISSKIPMHSSRVLSGEELLELFHSLHTNRVGDKPHTTVGMVGYPNVGKSSTINAILKIKKVPVSATPGRTKHFQTLIVDEDLMLCDCPGLVFPSFVTTKADLVVNGILPIDQMRNHVPPVSVVCQRIPREVLENTYGINIPKPGEGEDETRPPTAPELLNAHGYMRGYMTSKGVPDNPRSARYILKDYVNGKLLYCHPPPGVDQLEFQCQDTLDHRRHQHSDQPTDQKDELEVPMVVESSIDKEFFKKQDTRIHSKGVHGVSGFVRTSTSGRHIPSETGAATVGSSLNLTGKPWKKHNNRNKKEKSRRVHGYLD
ncbi:large subunit GTPase 1 homolog [Liolophura sinensis]|uniref:large subunit GTPase 1 homolog n=1 Tax=Liolophura sinensis TaxID=3198878 RepID=UPI003157F520